MHWIGVCKRTDLLGRSLAFFYLFSIVTRTNMCLSQLVWKIGICAHPTYMIWPTQLRRTKPQQWRRRKSDKCSGDNGAGYIVYKLTIIGDTILLMFWTKDEENSIHTSMRLHRSYEIKINLNSKWWFGKVYDIVEKRNVTETATQKMNKVK